MTLSEDFVICPWCDYEDDSWPIYHTKPIKDQLDKVCINCGKPYSALLSVEFIKIPVHKDSRKKMGCFIRHPIIKFETRKIVRGRINNEPF